MSEDLCHQYQFGLRGFEDCGDRRKKIDEIILFAVDYWGGGGQKYEM